MNRCVQCGHEGLVPGNVEETARVAGQDFSASVTADVCPECEEAYVSGEELSRFRKGIALELARTGNTSPVAFAFMRKAIGLRATQLAELLDVAPETVSRWEHGKTSLDRSTLAVLGEMVIEANDGRDDTIRRLRRMLEQRNVPSPVRLVLRPSHA